MKNFVYKNAPLVEIVCDVRWSLQTVPTLPPPSALDPHFAAFKEDVVSRAEALGFVEKEELVDPNVPREFRPYGPETRFRTRAGAWPLFQIGPGIFTANATPPYAGWTKFRTSLADYLRLILDSYPIPDRYMKINRVELRCINSFDNKFEYVSYHQFAEEHLNIVSKLPADIINKHITNPDDIMVNNSVTFPLKSPEDARAAITIASGTRESLATLVADLVVRKTFSSPSFMNAEALLQWFDLAHDTIHDLFEQLSTDALKTKMEPRIPQDVP